MANVSTPLLWPRETYEEVYHAFRWKIPASYNMAHDVCDRHATIAGKTALIYFDDKGREQRFSFLDIKKYANRLSNALEALDVERGDRVAILLSQCPEAALCHVAAHKMGAISLPLFTLFGPEALEFRLGNSEAKVLVTDSANLPKIASIRDRLPALRHVIVTDRDTIADGAGDGADRAFWPLLERASSRYLNVKTAAEDPCLLIYTSGTTGQPKGALHAHRTMLGHMPSLEFYHDFFPQPGDLFWSPADWAWIGGLMDNLMPAWFHGVPVLAFRARKFDPDEAFAMMATHRVRNMFLPPTALKLLRQVHEPQKKYDLRVRSIFTGGETMGGELLQWGYDTFGMTISEGYGQTECNLMVGNSPRIMDVYPGSMGRAVPGHVVEIIGDDGYLLPPGQVGHIAFKTPDPVAMLRYWRNPEGTKAKYHGDWMLSGDQGYKDEHGYFWFVGRADDVITSAGYRIGPGEIEECLIKHPAVAMAAAVGVPDPIRTESIKAFIQLRPGFAPSDLLVAEIQDHVRTRLAAHEYPRSIEFVTEFPMTATGKIRRTELRDRERKKAQPPA